MSLADRRIPRTGRDGDHPSTIVRFALTGSAGLVVNLLVFSAQMRLGIPAVVASAIAFEVAVLWNYLLNDRWTFRHRNLPVSSHGRGLRFNLVSLATLGIKVAGFVALSHAFPATSVLVHQTLATIPGALANYFINDRWTFARR